MKEIRGAIFDVDGLLFNTEQLYCDICIEVAPNYGIETYDESYYKKYLGTSNHALYTIYKNDFPFLSTEDVDHFIQAVQTKAEEFLSTGNVEIKAGAKEILSFLNEHDIPCVIASNNYTRFIESMLEYHEIRDHFHKIYSFDDVINPKPHPEIVNKASDCLNISKDNIVMFEDSSNGARAAIAAEVPVIMVPDMLPPPEEIRRNLLQECESLHHAKDFLSATYLFR